MHMTIKTILATTAMMFAISAVAQTTAAQTTASGSSAAGTNSTQASNASAKPARTTGRYIDDKTISAKISATFLADSELKSEDIKVETYKGVVHLTGSAISQDQINHAVHAARRTKGVKAVKSELEITPST